MNAIDELRGRARDLFADNDVAKPILLELADRIEREYIEKPEECQMKELKPCPLCGGAATLEHRAEEGDYVIECRNHGWRLEDNPIAGDVGLVSWSDSEDDRIALIEAWNNRHERTCQMEGDPNSMDEMYPTYEFLCSACGGFARGQRFEYCPNCGAKVVE